MLSASSLRQESKYSAIDNTNVVSLISNVQFAEGSRLTEKQTNSAIFFVSFLERVFHSTQVFTDDKAHV